MAFDYSNKAKQDLMTEIAGNFDDETFQIRNIGNTVLASGKWPDPAFNVNASGVASLASDMTLPVVTTGTATNFVTEWGSITGGMSGVVGTNPSTSDLTLTSTSLNSGDTVVVTSWQVTF